MSDSNDQIDAIDSAMDVVNSDPENQGAVPTKETAANNSAADSPSDDASSMEVDGDENPKEENSSSASDSDASTDNEGVTEETPISKDTEMGDVSRQESEKPEELEESESDLSEPEKPEPEKPETPEDSEESDEPKEPNDKIDTSEEAPAEEAGDLKPEAIEDLKPEATEESKPEEATQAHEPSEVKLENPTDVPSGATSFDDSSKGTDYQEPEPEPEPEPEMEEEKVQTFKQTHTIIIPSYASWFNMKKVHPIEKKSLPEFFEVNHPSKSPKIYLSYRNFMINAYRLNPNEYLTLTSCRRNLVGDVGTLMRVFKFLNKWGLINYQVNPSFKPGYNLERLSDGNVAPLPYSGDYKVNYDSPRGLFPFESFKLNSEVNIEKLKHLMGDSFKPANKEVDIKLTASTLDESGDNKRKLEFEDEEPSKKPKDSWTEDELKMLLKGIKLHKNDWFQISKHVGTKTPQECILKFLKMPIEDSFKSLSSNDFSLLKYSSNFPTSSTENPIINNLIFMTQLVDSDVAKAASERASKVMHEKILEKIEQVETKEKELGKRASKEDSKPENIEKDEEEEAAKNEFEDMIIEPKDDDDDDTEESDGKPDHKENGSVEQAAEGADESVVDSLKESLSDSLKELHTKSEDSTSVEDINSTLFAMVASKSHLFRTYEEREINRLTSTVLNQEMNKVNLKLERINKLEKIYETQHKIILKQQEEIFVDRLNLSNSIISITKKLNHLISSVESSKDSVDASELRSTLTEIKSLMFKPLKSSLAEDNSTTEATTDSEAENVSTPSMKPPSLQTPQTFKVWVP
ncbi:SWI/SNF and RSC complex subunit Ssr2 [Yamadazyma tenuis]|uniref:SWI/SNF and RSC complex subunit Ssr2 n=1 Tax=Candida tenuis TaxID=2315449 RepID=UPI00279E3E7B|nr:SWI/SNF and RSC complex subunit Ssr2 [Yamadazyma tenuis]